MAVFNRVYCSGCKKEHNVYDEKLRTINCVCCCAQIKVSPKEGKASMTVRMAHLLLTGRNQKPGRIKTEIKIPSIFRICHEIT